MTHIISKTEIQSLELECLGKPHNIELKLQLGCLFHKNGQFAEAVQTYEAILQQDPSHPEANLSIIVVLIDLNEYEDAHRRYLHFNQQQAHTYTAAHQIANHHKALAKLYKHEKKVSLANQELRKALQINPKDVQARVELSKTSMDQKDYSTAQQELEKVIAIQPDHDEALTMLGLVYHQNGSHHKAARHWMQARRLNHQQKAAQIMLQATQNSTTSPT
ncbi:MAG: tetratricopeptide repeat protein [Oligoflexales bacterium]